MKKYLELYHYFKRMIEAGELKDGEKLPSVRRASSLFSVSVTTVQNAYFELQADGYIIAEDRSGYYARSGNNPHNITETKQDKHFPILYDLKSGNADKDVFDLTLWQRYIKSALRQGERLLSYSEASGEYDLRTALCEYIKDKRNIIASPERILIGGGIQPLLTVISCLLKDQVNTVSFPDSSFYQGIFLLNSFGFNVHTKDKDADLSYVCPSHMTSYGDVMPIRRRLELVQYSMEHGSLIIEDDFDSDFVYSKPVPSLYTLSHVDNVIYMGSFSNVLIPGIRISFAVLPQQLSEQFRQSERNFAQTASKTEQIALCHYLQDGHIRSQTRKIRRIYTAKAKKFYEYLINALPDCKIQISDNGLQIKLTASYHGDTQAFKQNGIAVHIKDHSDGILKLVLTPSALAYDDIPPCAALLKTVLEQTF